MTPEQVKTTIMWWNSNPNNSDPHPFERLVLTLSKCGWVASVQWEGTLNSQGKGKTVDEAINKSIEFAKKEWDCRIMPTFELDVPDAPRYAKCDVL
jgi:hypothetical protein